MKLRLLTLSISTLLVGASAYAANTIYLNGDLESGLKLKTLTVTDNTTTIYLTGSVIGGGDTGGGDTGGGDTGGGDTGGGETGGGSNDDGPTANCPTPDSNVKIVDTGVPERRFIQTSYDARAGLGPDTIHSFKFKTTNQGVGRASSTRMTASTAAKMIVISKCPGDVDPTDKLPSCSRYANAMTTVQTVYGYETTDAIRRAYCELEPNTVYYANMIARMPSTGEKTCSNPSECSHTVNVQ